MKKKTVKKAGLSRDHFLLTEKAPFVMQEAYKSLRTNIMLSLPGTECKCIGVTSPTPGDGKTTTATNLAIALSQIDKRVLLIDSDMRLPAVAAGFRIAAAPGNKSYGILSVLIQAWYSVEYLFTVHEHVFNPPPKVKSAVIRMTRNSTTSLGCDEQLFKRLVKTTFNQRRKTLRNNIRPLLGELDTQCAKEGFPIPDHSTLLQDPIFNQRPEQLSVQQFIALTNRVSDEYKR